MHRCACGLRARDQESDTVAHGLEGITVTFRWSTYSLEFTEVEVTAFPAGSSEFSNGVEGVPEPTFLPQDKVTLRQWERVR